MAKYIELIDKYKVVHSDDDDTPMSYTWVDNTGEIVRCRECKYAHLTYDGDAKYCDLLASKDKYGDCDPFFYRSGDWYCADGERRIQDGQ